MHPAPLRECLLTRGRAHVTIRLSASTPKCTEPPFSSGAPELALWSWSWTDWPTFNRSVLDQDLKRILRWYKARGFYSAKIENVSFDPPDAGEGGSCHDGPCEVEVQVEISEGKPIEIQSVTLIGVQSLPKELQAALDAATEVHRGARFDENDYDRTKEALSGVLREASFAAARVVGKVSVDPSSLRARVQFEIEAGKSYTFGELKVTGQGKLPDAPIILAAGVEPGETYRPARVNEIRVEVLALGAFSTVEILETPDAASGRIDLEVKVAPLPPDELRLGIGITSGANVRLATGDLESIPQWDVHLFGRYERRHIFGTLGTLRLEDRPRLIFGEAFPGLAPPELGNILTVRINQPGLLEARTDVFAQASWDYGPDPYLGFRRSDMSLRLGARRGFLTRRLLTSAAVQQDIFHVNDDPGNVASDGSPTSSYRYAFLEQDLRLDLRDDSLQPSRGAYLGFNVTESVHMVTSDWTSFKLAPDARVYIPLPFASVLALRATLGAILILDADAELDDDSKRLGPSTYRLRGGGANSVRGFLPGGLGVGSDGGIRRWESMSELRIRLGTSFTVVGFLDMGDVNDQSSFRFGHLNTSIGFGLRYYTLIGPVRLDAGFRVLSLQRADGSPGIEEDANTFPFTDAPGALHLTIGDSF
jgi:translocation and assembly module TamA